MSKGCTMAVSVAGSGDCLTSLERGICAATRLTSATGCACSVGAGRLLGGRGEASTFGSSCGISSNSLLSRLAIGFFFGIFDQLLGKDAILLRAATIWPVLGNRNTGNRAFAQFCVDFNDSCKHTL